MCAALRLRRGRRWPAGRRGSRVPCGHVNSALFRYLRGRHRQRGRAGERAREWIRLANRNMNSYVFAVCVLLHVPQHLLSADRLSDKLHSARLRELATLGECTAMRDVCCDRIEGASEWEQRVFARNSERLARPVRPLKSLVSVHPANVFDLTDSIMPIRSTDATELEIENLRESTNCFIQIRFCSHFRSEFLLPQVADQIGSARVHLIIAALDQKAASE